MKSKGKKAWTWELHEKINSYLSEDEISDIINRKLAYIIVELEHNPVSYINVKNKVEGHC